MKDLEIWTWVQTGVLIVFTWMILPANCPLWCTVVFTLCPMYVTRILTIANRQDARRAVRQVIRQFARLAMHQG